MIAIIGRLVLGALQLLEALGWHITRDWGNCDL